MNWGKITLFIMVESSEIRQQPASIQHWWNHRWGLDKILWCRMPVPSHRGCPVQTPSTGIDTNRGPICHIHSTYLNQSSDRICSLADIESKTVVSGCYSRWFSYASHGMCRKHGNLDWFYSASSNGRDVRPLTWHNHHLSGGITEL